MYRDAKAYLNDLESRMRLGHLYVEPPDRFGRYSLDWADAKSPGETRKRQKLDSVRRHLSPLNTLYVNQVTVGKVEDALRTFSRQHPATYNHTLSMLKAILRFAEDRGQQVDPSVLRLRPVKVTHREGRYLSREELDRIAAWMPEHLRLVVSFTALTGLRLGEVVAVQDAHFRDGWLDVQGTKTEASKASVPLSPDALRVVAEQQLLRPAGASHLFTKEDGTGMSAPYLTQRWREAVALAGFAPGEVRFHDLRTTFISSLRPAGVDPVEAAKLARQRGLKLYFDVYAKVRPEELDAAAAKLRWAEDTTRTDAAQSES